MATYTHTMQLSTGGTLTFTKTLTDANAQRIIAAYKILLSAPAGATNAEVWSRIAGSIFDEIKGNTMGQELNVGRAAVTVTPIEST